MCGDYDSILGMDRDEPMRRFLTRIRGERLGAANGPGALSGVAVDTDDATGLAVAIAPIRVGPGVVEAMPAFWG
jgi:hypothetical protein